MGSLRILFVKRSWNPVSLAIRAAVPESITTLARASHCLIVDGDDAIEASMLHGVRSAPMDKILSGTTIVATIDYWVPDAEAGLRFCRDQINKPYDWMGAFGLGLAPERDWQRNDAWFCFELAAATLAHAGLDIFADTGRISGNMLMALRPHALLPAMAS